MPSFDYTSRDYLSIKQDILNRASELIPEWTSRDTSDFGVALVDLWAYIGDILHYYVDRAAAETYIGTAVNTESVLALANLFDYKPAYQTSATGTVTIGATSPTHSNTIIIPVGTGFVAPATDNLPAVYYTSTASASMGPSVPSVTVPVAEGKYVEDESPVNAVTGNTYSDGTAGQRFNLRYSGVVVSSVVVKVAEGTTVNGSPLEVEYFYTPYLSTAFSDDQVFDVEITADGIAQIVFGNGVNGKIPSNKAEITVSYRRGQGSGGNTVSGRVSSYDVGSEIADTLISSSSAMTGGTDTESIESMKINIPKMFRTQDRAVSLQDFKDLALRVPQVVKATCTVSGSNVTVYALPYQPEYLAETGTSLTVSNIIKDNVITYFEPRTVIGASVGAASSVSLTPVNITVDVYVQNNYVAYWVAEQVSDVLDSFFDFDNVSFGQVLPIGSVYRALQSITGVDYVIITVFSTSASGVSTSLTAASNALFRKGTITVNTSGGITGVFS